MDIYTRWLDMSEGERRSEARGIAENRYAFRLTLAFYLTVNPALVALWYFTGPFIGDDVFFWPILSIVFWGVWMVAHYYWAYRHVGGNWVAKETERILQEKDFPRADRLSR